MTSLNIVYASAPSADLLIPTLEFNNEAAGVIRLGQSFNDITATTEFAETVTFYTICMGSVTTKQGRDRTANAAISDL